MSDPGRQGTRPKAILRLASGKRQGPEDPHEVLCRFQTGLEPYECYPYGERCSGEPLTIDRKGGSEQRLSLLVSHNGLQRSPLRLVASNLNECPLRFRGGRFGTGQLYPGAVVADPLTVINVEVEKHENLDHERVIGQAGRLESGSRPKLDGPRTGRDDKEALLYVERPGDGADRHSDPSSPH